MKIVKSNFILLIAFALLFFNSCKKEDKVAPVITLNGDDHIYVGIGTLYNELGASAIDDKDGNLVPLISGLVNTNIAKTYTLTYQAFDKSGNTTSTFRYVIVKNLSDIFAGTFATHKVGFDMVTGLAVDSIDYTQTVGFSATVNNRITFTKFGNNTFAPSSTKINADLNGNVLTIPPQNANIITVKHFFRGYGTVSGDSLIQLTYFDSVPAVSTKMFTLKMQR